MAIKFETWFGKQKISGLVAKTQYNLIRFVLTGKITRFEQSKKKLVCSIPNRVLRQVQSIVRLDIVMLSCVKKNSLHYSHAAGNLLS